MRCSALLLAIAIGVGIFRGGVRLNLARFFRITGVFLVLVAAGLVLSSLRTAHEAGWILIGQQATVSLSWLAPTGSVQAALLTGVLGIPADPRLIEVLGLVAYLVPTMLFLLWPVGRRPKGRALATMRLAIASTLVIAAAALALAVSLPSYSPAPTASITGAGDTTGTITLHPSTSTYSVTSTSDGGWSTGDGSTKAARPTTHYGIDSTVATSHLTEPTPGQPAVLTLDELVNLNGGRLPIGVNAAQNPGPFAANWSTTSVTAVWIVGGGILDARQTSTTVATLTGGGLASSRTISPDAAQTDAWAMPATDRAGRVAAITAAADAASELLLWKLWIPIVLTLSALVLGAVVLRSTHRHPTGDKPAPASGASPSPTGTGQENYA